jgi:ABC-type transport system involved in multi-copper enzyme maturation permease subunit
VTAILHVARREWLEQRREPWMLAVVGALFGLVAALVVGAVAALDWLEVHPLGKKLLSDLIATTPVELVGSAVLLFDFLVFTQFLGIAAVATGHSMLHDRQCGTFTFLLLAPIRRFELLSGKVLGALGWPLALYVLIDGPAAVALALVPLARGYAELTAASPAFWVALLLGGPAWAAAVGSVGTVISSVARDVRTAQQSVWFVVFFATILAGSLLTWGLHAGPLAELAVAGLGAGLAATVLVGGAAALARDLGR